MVVGALGIGHHAQLEAGGVVTHDAPQVVFEAILPGAVLAGNDDFPGSLVAQLHVVNARRHAGVIDGLDDLVVKLVVVHQAAVADGAIEDLDFRAVRHPPASGRFLGFNGFGGFRLGRHKGIKVGGGFGVN